MQKIKDTNTYINAFSDEDKKMLEDLQKIIHSFVKCEDTIAYNMPAMKYNGKIICCFAVNKNHLGFYPYSGKVITKMKNDLKAYTTSKGSVHFPKGKKLPIGIVKKLLKLRIQEIDGV